MNFCIVVVGVVVLVMIVCIMMDLVMGEICLNYIGCGVFLGVVVGVVLGYLINMLDSDEGWINVFIGVGVGVFVGGVIGCYMDQQEEVMCMVFSDMGVGVCCEGYNLCLIMLGDVIFVINFFSIQLQFYVILNDVLMVLNCYLVIYVDVVGYVDSIGLADYNQILFEQCVFVVVGYLIVQGVM